MNSVVATRRIADEKRKVLGRSLWEELHTRAFNHNGTNDKRFIDEFSRKIPRFMSGCSCNEFWTKWLRANPPNYAKDKYFEWTVKAHNAVNAKLNKPIISLEDAIKIMLNKQNQPSQ